jgi:hypothetical protein
VMRECAYAHAFQSSRERAAALPRSWLNRLRPDSPARHLQTMVRFAPNRKRIGFSEIGSCEPSVGASPGASECRLLDGFRYARWPVA